MWVMWLRAFYGFTAILIFGVAGFGLYLYNASRSDWPVLVIGVGFGLLGAALLWRTVVGWKRPTDMLVPPPNRYLL